MNKGKVEEVLRVLSGFRNSRERATQLSQITKQIGPGSETRDRAEISRASAEYLGSVSCKREPGSDAGTVGNCASVFTIRREESRLRSSIR